MPAGRTGAARDGERRHAQDEREGRHEDGTEPLARRFSGRLEHPDALRAQRVGELHDQDRVLGREPDHGNQSHLEVDVARNVPEPHAQEGAEDAERDPQDDRERNRPALVLRGEHQEHQDEPEAEDEPRVTARRTLLERLAAVREPEALRLVLGAEQLLHRIELLPRAHPRRGRCRHQRRGEAVEPAQHARRPAKLGPDQRRERDHLLVRGILRPDVQPPEIFRRLPEARLRLGLHPVSPAVQVEVVDVERGEHRLERGEQVAQLDAPRLGRLPIHLHEHLRHFRPEGGGGGRRLRQLPDVGHGGLHLAGEGLDVLAASRLQVELEARGGTEPRDLGEVEAERQRVLQAEELAVHAREDVVERVLFAPLAPVLEIDEHRGPVRLVGLGQQVEPDQVHEVLDGRILPENPLDPFHHLVGPLPRGPVGELNGDDEEALVLGRDERPGHVPEQHERQHQQHRERRDTGARPPEHPADVAGIAGGGTVEQVVEPPEEPVVGLVRRLLEEKRAERGRERQRNEAGEQHRYHEGDRELAEHRSGDAAQERHRNEHGTEHEHDGHQGRGHLLHRFVCSLGGGQLFLVHDAFDVLDHHDRVVHHDADREHQGEQGEHVDRVPQREEPEEGPDHAHRHGQDGDQRRAPALEEEEHHQGHEQHRLAQGLGHLLNRGGHERGGVEGHLPLHPGGKAEGQLLHPVLECLPHLELVGTRAEVNEDVRGRLAIEPPDQVEILRSELHGPDVAHPHERAVLPGPHDNVGKLVRRLQAAERGDGKGELRPGGGRLAAEGARGVRGVLLLDRVPHVAHREAELRHPVRIEPDGHGEVEPAERRRVAHAVQPLELVHHVQLGVVSEIRGVEPRVIGVERGHEQDVGL